MASLSEKLNLDEEATEKWIVNLIRCGAVGQGRQGRPGWGGGYQRAGTHQRAGFPCTAACTCVAVGLAPCHACPAAAPPLHTHTLTHPCLYMCVQERAAQRQD